MIPTVSVIIRTCNLAHYLPLALESVLCQSYPRWEALVLDDASDDDTERVVAPYLTDGRIRYIRNTRRLGRACNLNLGLTLARGRYVSVLDADDLWCSPRTLATVVKKINAHPDIALVAVSVAEIDARGALIRPFPNIWQNDQEIRKRLLIENFLSQNAVCFRRSDACALKGYCETLQYTEDYELWLRLGLRGKIVKLPDVLAHYRIHPGSIGVRKRRAQIFEEMRVVWQYRAQYPYFFIAMLHRLVNLGVTFIPKSLRHAVASALHYHHYRTKFLHFITSDA